MVARADAVSFLRALNSILGMTAVLAPASAATPTCDAMRPRSISAPWQFAGPGGYAESDDPLRLESAGAAQAMVDVNGSWLLATANGGIWKSADIQAARPRWRQVLDGQPVTCTSIAAMEAHGSTVLAGCGGATSSEMGYDWMVSNGGDWAGVMISRDGGETWGMSAFPSQYYVTAFVLTSSSSFLVAARAHYLDRDDGGVWATTDGGATFTRTFSRPVYDLVREPASGAVLAALPWVADSDSVFRSATGGLAADWVAAASGITWDGEGRTPFYPTFALSASGERLFLGALTVNPSMLSDTASAIFHARVSDLGGSLGGGGAWTRVEGDPTRGHLDQDGMPKDRMALLVSPLDESMLFVAGNAGSVAWRVDWRKGEWTNAYGEDTADGSTPHVDCRRYFWEARTNSLILLSDGGAWLRDTPGQKGGKWRSLNGDVGAFELVSAHWDPNGKRWVGGAQDNDVVATASGSGAGAVALGFLVGDGTGTAVDSSVNPSRLWGSVENMGYAASDEPGLGRDGEEDGDGCHGFGFWRDGDGLLCPPLLSWFSGGSFPQFFSPWALHSMNQTKVLFFAKPLGAKDAGHRRSGIYSLDVPYATKAPSEIAPPTLEVATEDVYVVVAGGRTAGQPDASVLVLLNDSCLLHRSAASGGELVARPLPIRFAQPVVTPWRPAPVSEYVLGPMSHGRTASLAVSPADSGVVAVTGWTTVLDNRGKESVWLSRDGGAEWSDVGGGLREATAVIGQWRPNALLLLPLPRKQTTALLVGTATGVFVTFLRRSKGAGPAEWSRLGSCDQLPLVMVAGLSHEPKDDTLIAATMGRGAYVVRGAVAEMESMLDRRERARDPLA